MLNSSSETPPNFSKGLIPAIIQDSRTKNILMLGYMNQDAYDLTRKTGKVTFFSRSKERLWTKGETSGNFLDVTEILIDCDQDTILVKAQPAGPTCHTGAATCFIDNNSAQDLGFLENIIQDRIDNPVDGSYTNQLLSDGINKVAQKVGEEAVELVIEAKDNNKELFLGEAADLTYHFLVLLAKKGYNLDDVIQVLLQRHK